MEVAHPHGYNTLYAHLSRVEVTKGQQLAAGDAVGLLGSTGRSTGPHLHYEVQFFRLATRCWPGASVFLCRTGPQCKRDKRKVLS